MPFHLLPQSGDFFTLFGQMGRKVEDGARALAELMGDYTDVEAKAERILVIEHEGDLLTQEALRRVNTAFVTPFDREDIHRLASDLDDVLDHIEAAADMLNLHHIEAPLPEMVPLSATLAEAATETAGAMARLKQPQALGSYWQEINRLEHEGDRIYRRCIANLYSGEHDALDVLKYQDVVQEIEQAIDALEDVADTVEGIAMKYS